MTSIAEAGPSRRFRLRSATSEAHRRLEDIAGSGRGTEGLFASRASYVRYLSTMHRVRGRLEHALDSSGASRIFPRWTSRRIAACLADDLRDLGVQPAAFEASGQEMDNAGMLGLLYVLEGSALGARLLAKAAEDAGYTATFGARHLHAQTADPAAWRSFVMILDLAELDPAEEGVCTRAAADAFDLFANAYAAAADDSPR